MNIAASFLECVSVITYGKSNPLMLLASPRAVPAGTDVRTLKDPTGTELYAAAQSPEGQLAEGGPYLFPKHYRRGCAWVLLTSPRSSAHWQSSYRR